MKQNKRAIILGSNSFGGASTIALMLKEDYDVIGISRNPEKDAVFLPYKESIKNNFKFVKANINLDFEKVFGLIKEFKPENIIDFAGQGMVAESWANPEQWYHTNLVSKARLHQALMQLEHSYKYIRISTPEVYGNVTSRIIENKTYNPSTPYALSHCAVDMSLDLLNREFSFPGVIGRFANFYGPGQQLFRIIPRAILCGLTGKTLELHGGGASLRGFLYGTDVAEGVLKMITLGKPGEIYHFSPKEVNPIKEIVSMISSKIGIPMNNFVVNSTDRTGKDHLYLMSSEKAEKELSWIPKIGIDEGIDNTICWIKKNLSELLKTPLYYTHEK